jgi:hypothetical protein
MFPIPRATGVLAALVLVAIVWGHGWKTGWTQHSDRTEKAQKVAEEVRTNTIRRKKEIKEVVVYQYIDRWRTVVEKGDTIIKKVPVYVTAKADAQCTLTRGFVGVLDAAATGTPLRAPAGDLDAPAEGLAASAVAASVAGNYTACLEVTEQLKALQEWAKKSSEP